MKHLFSVMILSVGIIALLTNSVAAQTTGARQLVRNNLDGSQTLLGHTPSADIASSKFLRHADARETLDLRVLLPTRNQDQLNSLLQGLYDPKSPNYHHWLNPSQFKQQFGYSGSEVNFLEVRDYLKAQGLSFTSQSDNGLILHVNAAVPVVERAWGLHINHYLRNDGVLFFATDADPSIPPALAGKIMAIHGLDNLIKVHPAYPLNLRKAQQAPFHASAIPATPGVTSSNGTLSNSNKRSQI